VDSSKREPRWILKESTEHKEKEDVQKEDRNKYGRPMPQVRKDGRKDMEEEEEQCRKREG